MKSKMIGYSKEKKMYPQLKICERSLVVLFTGPKKGFVIEPGVFRWEIGEHSETWAESNFDDFNGAIELQN